MKEKLDIHFLSKKFKLIFFLMSFVCFTFIVKYNFIYHIYTFNSVIIPWFVITLILGFCTIFFKRKYYLVFATSYSLVSLALGVYFVYTAGGLNAPGIIWLMALPIAGSSSLGRRGSIVGFIAIIAGMILYSIQSLEQTELLAFFKANDFYRKELLTNIGLFGLCQSLLIYFHIKNNEKANHIIKENHKSLDNLLRIIVHDISNPLFLITAKMKKIRRNSSEKQEVDLDKVDYAISNLTEQLTKVREMKALKDGKMPVTREQTDIIPLIQESIEILELKASEKNIKFEMICNMDDCILSVDKVIFKNQIISNLLSNSIKFSHDDSIIKVKIDKDETGIHISIIDNGIGIPNTLLSNLFRFDKETSRRGTSGEAGTGFGLPLVKEFIVKLEGKIFVTSKNEENGDDHNETIFKVTFPINKS